VEFGDSYHGALPLVTMASIVKKPTSKFWFAAFRDANGKQRRITTGQTDDKKARTIADRLESTAKRKGSSQRVRESFANLYREFYNEDLPTSPLREFVARWLSNRSRETSPATISTYQKTAKRFLAFLGADADGELENITKTRITEYRNQLADKLAPATVNRDVKIVRMIFRQARLDGFILRDPAEGIAVIKKRDSEKPRRPLTIPEIQSVLSVADPEWQSLIKFGLYTGQRLADIASLTWSQVNLEQGEIRLVTRKTGKRILMPVTGPLRSHIEQLPTSDNPSNPLHPRAYEVLRSQNGRVGTLSNAFVDLMIQVGLRPPRTHKGTGKGREGQRQGTDISFHSLRHSAVSILKDAGIPDSVVMAFVGHSSAAMSARYTSVGKESLEKAQEAMPAL
jgi:integrase